MQVSASSPAPVLVPSARPRDDRPTAGDRYVASLDRGTAVHGADLETYRKVYGAMGAAAGAFASHFAMAGLGWWAGTAVAGAVGLGLPLTIAAGAAGAYAAFKLQAKTWIGRKLGGRLGGLAGQGAARAAWIAGVPLRSTHIETTKNYSYPEMTKLLGNLNHNSHARISPADAQAFISRLRPGDFVLTNDEASTPFALATLVLTHHRADFTHGLVYVGGGKVVEARMENGVREADLQDVLTRKHHAVALRPHYQPGQDQAVVDAARAKIGRPYDFKFKLGNDSLYCSEMVYEVLQEAAPEISFRSRPVLTRKVIVPSDLLRTPDADVVAEAGVGRTMADAYMAKFVP